ncbi:MAG: alpha/beta fold hydrolase [Elainellaceae cyanobacterium]
MPTESDQMFFLNPERKAPCQENMPLFVFLPGMDGTGELLHLQTESLHQSFDVRCLVIPSSSTSDWSEMADNVAVLIEQELDQQARPVYLCGESFGGCLAQKVVTRSPQLIDRLILVNPASSFRQRPALAWGAQFTQYLPDALYRLSCAGLLPFLAQLKKLDSCDRQALLRAMRSVSAEASGWRLSLLKDFDVTDDELCQVNVPALIIAGVRDKLLPSLSEAERLIEVFPNAQMHVLFGSGHTCLLEYDVNLSQILQATQFVPQLQQSASAPISAQRRSG